jgi:hypothetical protein
LHFISGTSMEAPEIIPLDAVLPGDTIQLHLSLFAPLAFGTYSSVWQVQQPDATTLGNPVKLEIAVQDLPTATPLPLPSVAVAETTSTPLVIATPMLIDWHNVIRSFLWQGTVLLQATGGTGTYRFYNGTVREETLIIDGQLTLTAQRCEPLMLDIWAISGVEVLHWDGKITYPEPGMCN